MKRYLYAIALILSILLSSCSQKGCPGGMCAPDHYYSSPKKLFGNKSLSKRTNKVRHRNFGTSNRKLFRQNNYRNKTKPVASIEYNNNWMSLNKNNKSFNSNIESSPFKTKKTKKPSNRKMHRAKRYKEPKRSKNHEEGLWDPAVKDWEKREKQDKEKKKDSTKKKGKGIKKIK